MDLEPSVIYLYNFAFFSIKYGKIVNGPFPDPKITYAPGWLRVFTDICRCFFFPEPKNIHPSVIYDKGKYQILTFKKFETAYVWNTFI